MSFLSVEVKGLKELQSYMASLNKSQRKVINREFKEAAAEIVNGMKRDAPVDTARLKNSISFTTPDELSVEIVAQSIYAPYLEFGTKSKFKSLPETQSYAATFKGGKGDGAVSPIVALTAWVRKKGLAATYSTTTYNIRSRSGKRMGRTKAEAAREKQIAWAIFQSIKKKGIKPQPFFFQTSTGASRLKLMQQIIAKKLESGIKLLIGD